MKSHHPRSGRSALGCRPGSSHVYRLCGLKTEGSVSRSRLTCPTPRNDNRWIGSGPIDRAPAGDQGLLDPLVVIEAVLGPASVVPAHRPIADDLRHDRGCGDRRGDEIPLLDRQTRHGDPPRRESVNEHVVGFHVERSHRTSEQGEVAAMQSVAVDPLRGSSTDGDRDGSCADPRVCAFPLTAAQQLGVADPLQVECAREDHRGRDERSCEGTSPPPRPHPRPWRTPLRAGVARSDPGLRPARSSRRREEPVSRGVPGMRPSHRRREPTRWSGDLGDRRRASQRGSVRSATFGGLGGLGNLVGRRVRGLRFVRVRRGVFGGCVLGGFEGSEASGLGHLGSFVSGAP